MGLGMGEKPEPPTLAELSKEQTALDERREESGNLHRSPPATKADIDALRTAIIGKIDETKTEITAQIKVPIWRSFDENGKPRVSWRRIAIVVIGAGAVIVTWIQTGVMPSFGAWSQVLSTAGISGIPVMLFRGRMAEDRKRLEAKAAPLVNPAMLEAVVGWLEQRMATAPDNGARHE